MSTSPISILNSLEMMGYKGCHRRNSSGPFTGLLMILNIFRFYQQMRLHILNKYSWDYIWIFGIESEVDWTVSRKVIVQYKVYFLTVKVWTTFTSTRELTIMNYGRYRYLVNSHTESFCQVGNEMNILCNIATI